MHLRSVLGAAAVIMLSACAMQVGESYKLDAANSQTLVVIGFKSAISGNPGYSVSFERLDPATCQPNPLDWPRAFDNQSPFSPTAYHVKERHYIMATFDPGTWVLSGMSYSDGMTRSVDFDARTLAFSARPGDFIYLGDYTFDGKVIKFDGYNHEGLNAHLAKYEGIDRAPKDHPRWFTPFGRGGPVSDCQTPRVSG